MLASSYSQLGLIFLNIDKHFLNFHKCLLAGSVHSTCSDLFEFWVLASSSSQLGLIFLIVNKQFLNFHKCLLAGSSAESLHTHYWIKLVKLLNKIILQLILIFLKLDKYWLNKNELVIKYQMQILLKLILQQFSMFDIKGVQFANARFSNN